MRVSFRNRNLGYPLLTPEPRDYMAGGFDIEPPEAFRGPAGINIKITYRLESAYLTQLVEEGNAAFQTLVVGSASFLREATPKTGKTVQHHTLDFNVWTGTIELMPYLTATSRIKEFASKEHDQEFAVVEPKGFTIEPHMILAIGNIHEIDIEEAANAISVVDIQPNPSVQPGEIRLDFAQPHIMVYVAPGDYQRIWDAIEDQRESRQQTLWPALFLHVITEGIRKLPEFREDYAWTSAFERALLRSGYDPDDEDALRNHALEYAQRIIFDEKKRHPLGLMLDAFAAEDADPQDTGDYE